jgi:hypothetical protein
VLFGSCVCSTSLVFVMRSLDSWYLCQVLLVLKCVPGLSQMAITSHPLVKSRAEAGKLIDTTYLSPLLP